jgi:hypothetical protein
VSEEFGAPIGKVYQKKGKDADQKPDSGSFCAIHKKINWNRQKSKQLEILGFIELLETWANQGCHSENSCII